MTKNKGPALFFCVDGRLLLYSCPVERGEASGDFINYPYSHYAVWETKYRAMYNVDYDYYPRGRVVYRKSDNTYLLYYDSCAEFAAKKIAVMYGDARVLLEQDEHYQCHNCNSYYVL